MGKTQLLKGLFKRYSKIDQHLVRHFKYNGAGPPSSFSMQSKITHFSNSMIFANQETGLCFWPTVESVYPYSSSILEFLLFV